MKATMRCSARLASAGLTILLSSLLLFEFTVCSQSADADRIKELELELEQTEHRSQQLMLDTEALQSVLQKAESTRTARLLAQGMTPGKYRDMLEDLYSQRKNIPSSRRAANPLTDKGAVAVCISGHAGSAMPDNLFANLILANPEYSFTVFFNLQMDDKAYDAGGQPPPVHTMHSLNDTLRQWGGDAHNWVLGAFEGHNYRDAAWIMKNLRVSALNRLGQDPASEPLLVNGFLRDVQCSKQISHHEKEHSVAFGHVIATTENAYFFHEFDLPQALAHLETNSCQVITKDCLVWDGINLRFALMTREASMKWLGERVWWYQSLFDHKTFAWNGEQLSKMQSKIMDIKHCVSSVNVIPVASARYTPQKTHCLLHTEFIDMETSCVPKDANPFVACNLVWSEGLQHGVQNRNTRLSAIVSTSKYSLHDKASMR